MARSIDEILSVIKEFKQTASQTDSAALAEMIGQTLGQAKTQDSLSSDLSARSHKDTDVGQDEILKTNAAFDQALMTLNKKGQADAYGAIIVSNFLENQRQQTAQFEMRLRQAEEMFSERRLHTHNINGVNLKTLDTQDSATPAK